jgi:hypothetical protein
MKQPLRNSGKAPAYGTDREEHLRSVRRDLGDDPSWNDLMKRIERLEDLLDDWEGVGRNHGNINDDDLREWLDAAYARLLKAREDRS